MARIPRMAFEAEAGRDFVQTRMPENVIRACRKLAEDERIGALTVVYEKAVAGFLKHLDGKKLSECKWAQPVWSPDDSSFRQVSMQLTPTTAKAAVKHASQRTRSRGRSTSAKERACTTPSYGC